MTHIETLKRWYDAFSGNWRTEEEAASIHAEQMQALQEISAAIAEAEAEQAQPVANGKLKVTLQDTPTEIELTQYKRMFEAACYALGVIGEALGVDEDEGGAEPILAAIAELKASPCPTCKALARTVMMDQTAHDTAPPQRKLTHEQGLALCEANFNAEVDAFFKARPHIDYPDNRRVFYAGHRRGWLSCADSITGDNT